VLRYATALALPVPAGFPLGTFAVNVVGAFVLGWLLTFLGRREPETPTRRNLRLGIGTGVLGGFTTYSSFALEAERLLAAGNLPVAGAYVAATLIVGTLAAWLGVLLGSGPTMSAENTNDTVTDAQPDAGSSIAKQSA
jgi:CrcB protein